MWKSHAGLAVILVFVTTFAASAQDGIPDLVGRWTIRAEGMSFPIPGDGGLAELVAANAEFDIEKQDGFRISGREMSQSATGTTLHSDEEQFAGVIGTDNKTVSMVDENGFRDCVILAPDRMDCIYRHVGTPRAVVTRNTWIRQEE